MRVLVSELSVDGNVTLGAANANRLSATIFVEETQEVAGSDDADANIPDTESITVVAAVDPSAVTGAVTAPGPVFIVQPTGDDFYNALLGGFAAVAAERVAQIPPEPENQ